ncbi:unnamed protein product [Pseudo-nitzschia multistriata]|uniref:Uncharacterized protein n=1 Tax=Pseudo-nitzschia multistriata TaxID=183589 RepID=A0A448ZL37_9STRA|nr:unnamed protein product [Pseudo-nitzschia multistriata]
MANGVVCNKLQWLLPQSNSETCRATDMISFYWFCHQDPAIGLHMHTAMESGLFTMTCPQVPCLYKCTRSVTILGLLTREKTTWNTKTKQA